MGPPNPRPYSPEPTEDDGRASTLEKAPTHVEDRIRSEVEQKYVLAGIEKKLGELGQGLEKMDRKVAKLDEKVESLMLGTSAYQKAQADDLKAYQKAQADDLKAVKADVHTLVLWRACIVSAGAAMGAVGSAAAGALAMYVKLVS